MSGEKLPLARRLRLSALANDHSLKLWEDLDFPYLAIRLRICTTILPMHETLVIADSSCLILLSKIEELEILRSVYKQIHITPEIAEEFGLDLPDWIEIKEVNNKALQLLFQETLDVGESSALALAYETQDCTVIIDELKARKTAAKMNIRMTGTIGLILIAKNQNKISSAKSVFDKIRSTNFRISDRIINEALKEAGELSP